MGDILTVRSEVAGVVLSVNTKPGYTVAEGDEIAVIEAMKMEVPVTAPSAGRVEDVTVADGDVVEDGTALVIIAVGGV